MELLRASALRRMRSAGYVAPNRCYSESATRRLPRCQQNVDSKLLQFILHPCTRWCPSLASFLKVGALIQRRPCPTRYDSARPQHTHNRRKCMFGYLAMVLLACRRISPELLKICKGCHARMCSESALPWQRRCGSQITHGIACNSTAF